MPAREISSIESELSPPFQILEPARQTAPFVFSSPHSGRVYPSVLREATRLDALSLRKSEDALVDLLLAGVTLRGAPLIAARFARAYLDVNREPYELDPVLFSGPLPAFANTRSMRVAGGLGTIARIVADEQEIYRAKPSLQAALVRIDKLYRPYHRALTSLLDATSHQFGYSVLIDCHSMPSSAMSQAGSPRADIVLGDRFGASCDPRITKIARDALTELGYEVQLNRPYAGGYITEHYGQPAKGQSALQIEINRALYLNEATLEPREGFVELANDLMALADRLFEAVPVALRVKAAAE